MMNENADFLSIYDTASDAARAIWKSIEATADAIESAPQDVLAEVMCLSAAWGAQPSIAKSVMLGAVYITHLHRLGGLTTKAPLNAPRDLERFCTLIINRTFRADTNGKLAASDIMPAVRRTLAEDERFAKLGAYYHFTVASNNKGYRLLKRLLTEGASRVTNCSGRETLYGWSLR